MRVTWNPTNAVLHRNKHGVSFGDAELVLYDPLAITMEDARHDEQRYVSIGADATGKVLVVVYAYADNETIWLISARKATRKERQHYATKRH